MLHNVCNCSSAVKWYRYKIVQNLCTAYFIPIIYSLPYQTPILHIQSVKCAQLISEQSSSTSLSCTNISNSGLSCPRYVTRPKMVQWLKHSRGRHVSTVEGDLILDIHTTFFEALRRPSWVFLLSTIVARRDYSHLASAAVTIARCN
jgi:hypothetical protein